MKLEVKTASFNSTSLTTKGVLEKTQYYLKIGDGETAAIINVGEKTFEKINKLTDATTIPQPNIKK